MRPTPRRSFLALMAAAPAAARDWHQWRGPNRDGYADETGLANRWPAGGPRQLWQVESLGEGFSSFAVHEGHLLTQAQFGEQEFAVALDAATGDEVWRTATGVKFIGRYNYGNGPRGTPTVDGDRAYTLNAVGDLHCLEAATGEVVWTLNLLEEFGGENIVWAMSESPLVDGDRLIIQPGGKRGSIAALDKATGEVQWATGTDEAGYASAVVSEAAGVRQYITLTADAAVAVRASDGKELWRYTRVANDVANIATPIVRGEHVFVSTDYDIGGALLHLAADGDRVNADEVYFTRNMRNHYSSSILIDDHLYGFSGRILTCMEFLTGDVAWRARSVGKGQIIYADGKLYILGEDGVAGMARPTPEGYEELGRFEIGRGERFTWTLPVVHAGRLYLRDQNKLYCYDISGQAT